MQDGVIVIAGAGAVGCYVGGCLALAGRRVRLLGRPAPMQAISRRGLRISDRSGRDDRLPPGGIEALSDASVAFRGADLVLVTVKSGGTRDMARRIAAEAPRTATVVSLQNGIANTAVLAEEIGPPERLLAGMVPFNLILSDDADGMPHVHRGTGGRIHLAEGAPKVVAALDVPGLPIVARPDMESVAWGKLVLNLNNGLNALCGLPLRDELADRRWRLILAAQMEEALRVIRASGRSTARIDGVDPRFAPFVLRLPDLLFRLLARRMLAIDPTARSSMWDDLERRRPTEIDHLQGVVMELAAGAGLQVPTIARVHMLLRAAEAAAEGSPRLTPDEVAGRRLRLR